MMCHCGICGVIIQANVPDAIVAPGVSPENAPAARLVIEFDMVARQMALHLSSHQAQALEMLTVQQLAAKVYAMTWAESSGEDAEKFRTMRNAWRDGMIETIKKQAAQADAAEPSAPAGGGVSSSDGSGSNEKKSERNAST